MGEIHWKTEQARRRTFWPINTADKIWRPRAKAWFLKLPCLTWPVVKIIVSRIKTSRNWRGIPHFHTPSFYINIDQLLKISKKTLRIRIGKTWWSHRVGHGDRRNTAARKKNNSLGAAVALASHCGDPGESPTETPKRVWSFQRMDHADRLTPNHPWFFGTVTANPWATTTKTAKKYRI